MSCQGYDASTYYLVDASFVRNRSFEAEVKLDEDISCWDLL